MKKQCLLVIVSLTCTITLITSHLLAQNTSPYWSLAGNSNAAASSKLGTTNLIPLRLFTNNTERLRIDSTGKVGIGITNPLNILTVKSSGSTPASSWLNGLNSPVFAGFGETVSSELLLAGASNTAINRAVFQGRRSRGTLAAPSVVVNNDYIASLLASAYDGSTFQNPALVSFFVDGTPSAGHVPARISFVTGTNSSDRLERLKVGSTGNFTFNNNQLFLEQASGALGMGNISPNASSILDIRSTAKGVLLPRMTAAQKNAIASPAEGLLVYQTDVVPGLYYYSSGWKNVTGSGGGSGANTTLSNLTSPTAINTDLIPGITNTRNFGSVSSGWKNLYLTGDFYLDGSRFVSNTGTNTFIGASAGTSITKGTWNTAIGNSALYYDTTGTANVAVGHEALYLNKQGSDNTAIGYWALRNDVTGSVNTATGSYALSHNTTATGNSAFGWNALFTNTTGISNVAVGTNSLYSNTSAFYNVAVGHSALYSNTTGTSNEASGYQSLYSNTTGNSNTANGFQALNKNKTSNYNTATGALALFNNTAEANTANGFNALYSNTTGKANTAIGIDALYSNTTSSDNTASGAFALFASTGSQNTANGSNTLFSNTMGVDNTAIGYKSLYSNTTGAYNTASGALSLYSNADGLANTAIGLYTLYSNTDGNYNTSVGSESLYGNTLGNYNTALGGSALKTITTQLANTGIGYEAGRWVTTENSTALGAYSGAFSNGLTNWTALGYASEPLQSDQVMIGSPNVTSIVGYVDFTNISDGRYKKNIKENVPGLEFIKQLRPITYNLDVNGINVKSNLRKRNLSEKEGLPLKENASEQNASVNAKSKIAYTGFIAQEVAAAAKKLNYDFSGVDAPQTDNGLYGLRYAQFVVPLVKAVQELSAQNESLKEENKIQQGINISQQQQIDELKNMVTQMQTVLQSPSTSINSEAKLDQNVPNPFTNSTTIKYYLPITVTSAQIIVSDISGRLLKQFNNLSSGNGSIIINNAGRSSGMYQYSLVIDGKVVNTKKMIMIK